MNNVKLRMAVAFLLLASPFVHSQTSNVATKQFLYKVQSTRVDMAKSGANPEEKAALGERFAYLKELSEKGVVVLVGYTLNTDETSFGIVVLSTASEDAARDIMNRDPAVKKGVLKATLFPYRTVLTGGKPMD
jgi:uncharacterized protein YciI